VWRERFADSTKDAFGREANSQTFQFLDGRLLGLIRHPD
jgi:hypothetical protein